MNKPPPVVSVSARASRLLKQAGDYAAARARVLANHERRARQTVPSVRVSTYRLRQGEPSRDVTVIEFRGKGKRALRIFSAEEWRNALEAARRASQRDRQRGRSVR